MHFLKCSNCGHLNEVKSEYLIFCSKCDKKLDNNYSDWKKRNNDGTLDDFKQAMCVSDQDIQKRSTKAKSMPKGLKYWIGFAGAFAIFYAIGQIGGDKISDLFNKSSIDKTLMAAASEINSSCPIMIDNVTRLDNAVALPDNVFQYNYTLVGMVKDSIDVDELKNNLEPIITNYVKTNPDMKIMRDKDVNFKYYYKDMVGIYLFTISIGPDKYK